MYCVWRAYLEGSIQVSQSRISTCENYKVQVSDQVKMFRLQKEQQLKKVPFLLTATFTQGFLTFLLALDINVSISLIRFDSGLCKIQSCVVLLTHTELFLSSSN